MPGTNEVDGSLLEADTQSTALVEVAENWASKYFEGIDLASVDADVAKLVRQFVREAKSLMEEYHSEVLRSAEEERMILGEFVELIRAVKAKEKELLKQKVAIQRELATAISTKLGGFKGALDSHEENCSDANEEDATNKFFDGLIETANLDADVTNLAKQAVRDVKTLAEEIRSEIRRSAEEEGALLIEFIELARSAKAKEDELLKQKAAIQHELSIAISTKLGGAK